MKKTLAVFFLAIISLFSLTLPYFCQAQDKYRLEESAKNIGFTTGDGQDVYSMSKLVIQILLSVLAIAFFGLMLYAGIRWMTAMGKEDDVTKAKETIVAAIIGLAIIGAAYAITLFVMNALNPSEERSGRSEVNCSEITERNYCQGPYCVWRDQDSELYGNCFKKDPSSSSDCSGYSKSTCDPANCDWGWCETSSTYP